MEKQYIEIAKDFSTEIRKQYPNLDIVSIRFASITEDQEVEVSALPYNLDNAKYAIVVCDYDYLVQNIYSSNFFVLFIDDSGRASNKLEIDGWRFFFDEPVTGGRPSPARHCYILGGDVRLDINCSDCEVSENIPLLWKLFMKIKSSESSEEIRKIVAPYSVGNTVYLYKKIRELK